MKKLYFAVCHELAYFLFFIIISTCVLLRDPGRPIDFTHLQRVTYLPPSALMRPSQTLLAWLFMTAFIILATGKLIVGISLRKSQKLRFYVNVTSASTLLLVVVLNGDVNEAVNTVVEIIAVVAVSAQVCLRVYYAKMKTTAKIVISSITVVLFSLIGTWWATNQYHLAMLSDISGCTTQRCEAAPLMSSGFMQWGLLAFLAIADLVTGSEILLEKLEVKKEESYRQLASYT